MALIICLECGKQVSNTVERCIHCGKLISNPIVEIDLPVEINEHEIREEQNVDCDAQLNSILEENNSYSLCNINIY